jgi:hypothetical protein
MRGIEAVLKPFRRILNRLQHKFKELCFDPLAIYFGHYKLLYAGKDICLLLERRLKIALIIYRQTKTLPTKLESLCFYSSGCQRGHRSPSCQRSRPCHCGHDVVIAPRSLLRCYHFRDGRRGLLVGSASSVDTLASCCCTLDAQLTHDRTPPINPRLYPVAKSLAEPGLSPLGISRRRLRCDSAEGLVRGPPLAVSSKLAERAGLPGRLACQNCLSSLPSSWPVVVQFVRIASLISVTWRFRSSSFFLSQETLSSCREVPRLN